MLIVFYQNVLKTILTIIYRTYLYYGHYTLSIFTILLKVIIYSILILCRVIHKNMKISHESLLTVKRGNTYYTYIFILCLPVIR